MLNSVQGAIPDALDVDSGYTNAIARLLAGLLLAMAAAAAPAQDLSVSLTAPSDGVAGTSLEYGVSVFNAGSGTANNVEVTDTLPVGVLFEGDSLNACAVSSTASNGQQTVVCNLGSLSLNQSVSFDLLTRVKADFACNTSGCSGTEGTAGNGAVNTATVSHDGTDPDSTNDTDTADTLVEAVTDLDIELFTAAADPVPAGEQFTLTIIVDNLGPSTAENIVINDTLVTSNLVDPNGCSLAVRTDGGAIDQFDCNFALSTGVFDLAQMGSNWLHPRGALCDWPGVDGPNRNCDTVTDRDLGRIIITINMTATEEVDLEDLADVISDTTELDTSNNAATIIATFEAVADLGVTKVADTSPVIAGETASWSVEVTNHGPSAAVNTLLIDHLPAGLVAGSIALSGELPDDPNDVDTDPEPIACPQGGGTSDPPCPCVLGTPGDPAAPLICDLGAVPAAGTATLTVTGLVHPDFVARHDGLSSPPGLTNDVEVTSETLDAAFEDCATNGPCNPAPDEPNFASATASVTESADLDLDKTARGEVLVDGQAELPLDLDDPGPFPATPNYEAVTNQVSAGRRIRYRLTVTNNGPSVARGVVLADPLPAGLTFVPGTFVTSQGSCTPGTPGDAADPMGCSLGELASGASASVELQVAVDEGTALGTEIENVGSVLAETPDPDVLNDSASNQTTVTTVPVDRFTEEFEFGELDMDGMVLELTPAAEPDDYEACVFGASPDPISPTPLTLGDDDFAAITLSGDNDVVLFRQKYDTLYVGSNGYITFGQGDTGFLASLESHFSLPRISGVFADLDPGNGGQIGWLQQADRVIVEWDQVPLRDGSGDVTVRMELFFDGRIRIAYLDIDQTNAIAGISDGNGVPDPFAESDLSGYNACSVFRDSFEVVVDPSPGWR